MARNNVAIIFTSDNEFRTIYKAKEIQLNCYLMSFLLNSFK